MSVRTEDRTYKTTPKVLEEVHLIKDKTELFIRNIKRDQSQPNGMPHSRHMTLMAKVYYKL